MTSTQPSVVRLEGTDTRIRKLMKDLNGRATILVRGGKGVVYAGVPNQELGWLDKIARDIGVKKAEIPAFPKYEKAPCGVFTTAPHYHVGRCRKCAALRPQKSHDGESKTVVRVEGLHDLTLNGLIGLMKGKMDEAMALAQEYDTVVKALEKVPELQLQLGALTKQIDEHRQALKYFTEKR